jgi:ABC-type amino acid transport substrate-binding protein
MLFFMRFFKICGCIFISAHAAYASTQSVTVSTFSIPPWGMFVASQPAGITFEMANVIAKEAGLKIDNTILPFPRFWMAMQSGEIDFGLMHRTPESEAVAEPLARTFVDPEIILLPKKGLSFRQLEDMANLSLGVTRGGLELQDARISQNKSIRIFEFTNESQGIRMLHSNRFDCIISSKEAILYEMKAAGFAPSDFGVPLTLSQKEGWVMFSKKSPRQDLKERIRQATQKLQKQGVFLKIRKKYLGY